MHSTGSHTQIESRALAILVVDPDTVGATQITATLSKLHHVTVVPSASAAFNAIGLSMPDLVVTEIDLPDASGIEFVTSIHNTAATHNVLLMVVTRRASVRDKVAAFQAGVDDYLVKPVEAQNFLMHVLRLLRFRRIIQE